MKAILSPVPGHIRVLLIGGQVIFRKGLRMLLDDQPGLVVVGEAANLADALNAARRQSDVILIDLDTGGDAGFDLTELLMVANGARLLALTNSNDSELHLRAMRLGAMGLVLKDKPIEVLVEAIEKVHTGQVWLDGAMMANLLGVILNADNAKKIDSETDKIATITEREHEVIGLIAEGLKNKHIAERLFISETTVRHHLTSIFDKLGVSSRLELVVYSYKHDLAKPLVQLSSRKP